MKLIGGILKGCGLFWICGVIWGALYINAGFMDIEPKE